MYILMSVIPFKAVKPLQVAIEWLGVTSFESKLFSILMLLKPEVMPIGDNTLREGIGHPWVALHNEQEWLATVNVMNS